MRIAYLGSKGLPSKSGVERVVEAITQRLSDKHDITVYCDARYTPKDTTINGIHLIRISTIKGKYTQASSLFFFSAMHALFCKYDVIHLHSVDACFILPILRIKYKVVSTSHGAPGRLMREKWGKVARFIIRLMEYPYIYLSNCATSVSSLDADYLNARYKRNVLYIPNGVEKNIRYDDKKAEKKLLELGLEPGNFLIFAAGRIDPTKGCHLVLEALDHIGYPLKLAIIGDLNQVPSYSERLKKVANKDRVIFIPPISDRDLLFGLIKLAHLFIFPSISEGMSMMLLEAASLQMPIVCSDIPENKIVMQNNALYFRSEDVGDLSEKIRWALAHQNEMSSLGQRGGNHVNEHMTWEKIVTQYEDIYRACVKEK